MSGGYRPAFGGAFENYIKDLVERKLVQRNKRSPKVTFIIPDIPKIKGFLEKEVITSSIYNLSSLDIELIKNRQIVDISIKILQLLSDNITRLNEVVNRSKTDKIREGSLNHKIFVKRTLTEFAKSDILQSINLDENKNEPLQLTTVGKSLVNLVKSIRKYRNSYASLIEAIKENFDIRYDEPENINASVIADFVPTINVDPDADVDESSKVQWKKLIYEVQKKKWAKDAQQYLHYQWEADHIKAKCAGLFLIALFSKYVMLLFDISKNNFAINILTEIVMRAIQQHRSDIQKYFFEIEKLPRADFVTNWMYNNDDLRNYFFGDSPANKVIRKEVSKVKESLHDMWQIDREAFYSKKLFAIPKGWSFPKPNRNDSGKKD